MGEAIFTKSGTITISVYHTENNPCPIFQIQTDNTNILPISDVLEDTLKLY